MSFPIWPLKERLWGDDEHVKVYGKSMIEAQVFNLNPPRWYDKFLFWKKRIPVYKTMMEMQRDYNEVMNRLIDEQETREKK